MKMECRGRRSRKGRCHSCANRSLARNTASDRQCSKSWSFLSSLYSFFILSTLIGIIYLMLEHHCNTCSAKCDLNSINKKLEDIAKNLACMKKRYLDLEMKICQFTHELPKIEGQIEILETLAKTIEDKDRCLGWDPRTNLTLSNVDVFLNKPPITCGKNITKCCPKRPPKLKTM